MAELSFPNAIAVFNVTNFEWRIIGNTVENRALLQKAQAEIGTVEDDYPQGEPAFPATSELERLLKVAHCVDGYHVIKCKRTANITFEW